MECKRFSLEGKQDSYNKLYKNKDFSCCSKTCKLGGSEVFRHFTDKTEENAYSCFTLETGENLFILHFSFRNLKSKAEYEEKVKIKTLKSELNYTLLTWPSSSPVCRCLTDIY